MQVEIMFSKIAMGLPFQIFSVSPCSNWWQLPTPSKETKVWPRCVDISILPQDAFVVKLLHQEAPAGIILLQGLVERKPCFFSISGEVSTSKVWTSAEILGWRSPQFHPIQGITVVHLPRISSRFPLILTGSRKFRWYHPMIIPIIHQRRLYFSTPI